MEEVRSGLRRARTARGSGPRRLARAALGRAAGHAASRRRFGELDRPERRSAVDSARHRLARVAASAPRKRGSRPAAAVRGTPSAREPAAPSAVELRGQLGIRAAINARACSSSTASSSPVASRWIRMRSSSALNGHLPVDDVATLAAAHSLRSRSASPTRTFALVQLRRDLGALHAVEMLSEEDLLLPIRELGEAAQERGRRLPDDGFALRDLRCPRGRRDPDPSEPGLFFTSSARRNAMLCTQRGNEQRPWNESSFTRAL